MGSANVPDVAMPLATSCAAKPYRWGDALFVWLQNKTKRLFDSFADTDARCDFNRPWIAAVIFNMEGGFGLRDIDAIVRCTRDGESLAKLPRASSELLRFGICRKTTKPGHGFNSFERCERAD